MSTYNQVHTDRKAPSLIGTARAHEAAPAGRNAIGLVLFMILVSALWVQTAVAGQLYPDQENLVQLSAGWSAKFLAPIGQTFEPSDNSVDAVELMLSNTDTSSPYTTDVEINIREDNIFGAILGTSEVVSIPFGKSGVVHFDFPESVRVRRGGTYAIEIVVNQDGGNLGVAGGWVGSYEKGSAIIQGELTSDNSDLWFREGTHRASHPRRN